MDCEKPGAAFKRVYSGTTRVPRVHIPAVVDALTCEETDVRQKAVQLFAACSSFERARFLNEVVDASVHIRDEALISSVVELLKKMNGLVELPLPLPRRAR